MNKTAPTQLTDLEAKLLATLKFYAPDDECQLENWQLARHTGLKKSAIARLLKSLEEKGRIRRHTTRIVPPCWRPEARITAERTIEIRRTV